MNLTKLFSEKDSQTAEQEGMFAHVKFKIYNTTDKTWLTANYNRDEGVYYVTGHVAEEKQATVFNPVTTNGEFGHVVVKGCEDDAYVITEIETANGYTLLKDGIKVNITASDDHSRPCDIYAEDVLGVLQNDPHYSFDGGHDLKLANIPQVQLAHNFMTASATVDGNAVNMEEDNGSLNAKAPLTIVNTTGFDLPQTGDYGTWMFTVGGIVLMGLAATVIVVLCRKKAHEE